MQTTVRSSPSYRQLQRKLLRALNGAALGAVVGGLLGAGLGAASSCLVDALGAKYLVDESNRLAEWTSCALAGMLPAVPVGGVLGTSIIIRKESRRLFIGLILGLMVGIAYACLWSVIQEPFWGDEVVLVGPHLVTGAIVISGLAGGASLALILTAIRRHWPWWTRWEEEALHA